MLRFIPVVLALAGLLLSSAIADMTAETARVRSVEARVWSGPGEQFYPTSRIERGEPIEIYQRRTDGWCAIRPPEGSFSYVRADHVRQDPSRGLLEVTRSGTKTRVGSALGLWNQVEYVSLRRGEKLEPLGRPVRLESSPGTWYRIAPPSGEFRWMHVRDLQQVGSVSGEGPDSIRPEAPHGATVGDVPSLDDAIDLSFRGSMATPLRPSSDHSSPGRDPTALQRQLQETTDGTVAELPSSSDGIALVKLARERRHMATEPMPHPVEADRGDAPRVSEDAASQADREPTSSGTEEVGAAAYMSPSGAWRANSSDPNLRLSELELALSRMVALDIRRWELERLRDRAIYLSGEFVDEAGQHRVAQLVERIDEFAALQRRQQELDDVELTRGDEDNQGMSLAAALSRRASVVGYASGISESPPASSGALWRRPPDTEPDGPIVHYAGQGWLVPVLSAHPHLPRFALTDPGGAIQAFVSPRAGLNLRRYLRQEVGIVGRETARSDDSTPHLLAERVVLLDRHR